MISITALWLPILVSAVLVFIASSIIHMMLPYHRNDWGKLPDEEGLMDAMGKAGVTPGDYVFPCASTPAEMSSPEMKAKYDRGPVGFVTIFPNGPPNMAKSLTLWFGYALLIGIFCAYVATRTLGPGTEYLSVFRLVGTIAFCCYSMALVQNSIWYGRGWGQTVKTMFDGLVYALLTAGAFGWLWP